MKTISQAPQDGSVGGSGSLLSDHGFRCSRIQMFRQDARVSSRPRTVWRCVMKIKTKNMQTVR